MLKGLTKFEFWSQRDDIDLAVEGKHFLNFFPCLALAKISSIIFWSVLSPHSEELNDDSDTLETLDGGWKNFLVVNGVESGDDVEIDSGLNW